MGNFFGTKQITETEPIIDKTRETAENIWNQMETENVFELSIGQTLTKAQYQFPNYKFRMVSLDGYVFPINKSNDNKRINVNMITVDGQQIIDSINSIG